MARERMDLLAALASYRASVKGCDPLETTRIEFINLDPLRDPYGERWPKVRERIFDVCQAFIERRIGPGDLVKRAATGFMALPGPERTESAIPGRAGHAQRAGPASVVSGGAGLVRRARPPGRCAGRAGALEVPGHPHMPPAPSGAIQHGVAQRAPRGPYIGPVARTLYAPCLYDPAHAANPAPVPQERKPS